MCSKLIRQINGTYLKDDGTNIGNLDMAAQRQLPQDILNVEYAMKNYGYVPPTSQSTSQSTPPAGMVPIPGAQYDTREKQQAVFSNIQPIGNTLYGVPKQQQQQQEQNTPENAPENNPADTFNLLIGNALSKFQGVNTADLEKKKRALQLAASDRISDITPEELRTFSPAQQAAIRSGDVSSLQPEFDEVAYQLNKAQQAAANFENVYEKIVNISGEYAEKMVAPDSVIQNYKQLIEANPDDINTYLAKVNDKTRDAILNVLDYEKMKPKEKIDTQTQLDDKEIESLTEKFTTTQINKGAQKSGLTIQEFERLPIDAANVFINGTDQDIQVLLTGIYFDEHSGSDGYVSPDDYNSLKKDFIDAGYSGEDFDRQMALYRNPGNNFYNIGSDSIDWSSLREPEKKNIFQRIKSWF